MKKFDVQIALEGVRDARLKWSRAQREFQTNMEMVLLRLLHEAAANYMSVEEVSRASKLSPKRVRNLMRVAGLNPRDGKTLLAETAADALATNANLLGIAPHEMDLMSPLAYLPMGSELRQQLTDKTTSQVHELDDDEEATRLINHIAHCTANTCCVAQVSGNGVYDLPTEYSTEGLEPVSRNQPRVVTLGADDYRRLERLVEQSDGIVPVSVESLVGMAVGAFLDGTNEAGA